MSLLRKDETLVVVIFHIIFPITKNTSQLSVTRGMKSLHFFPSEYWSNDKKPLKCRPALLFFKKLGFILHTNRERERKKHLSFFCVLSKKAVSHFQFFIWRRSWVLKRWKDVVFFSALESFFTLLIIFIFVSR